MLTNTLWLHSNLQKQLQASIKLLDDFKQGSLVPGGITNKQVM